MLRKLSPEVTQCIRGSEMVGVGFVPQQSSITPHALNHYPISGPHNCLVLIQQVVGCMHPFF